MSNYDRIASQKRSHEWADSFDGKEVIVFFNTFTDTWPQIAREHNVIGIAKRVKPYLKWGRLIVYINKDEYSRIVANEFQWNNQVVITIEERGLCVYQDINEMWFCNIIWSERECLMLWESYKKEYVIERLQEVGTSSK